MEKLNKTNQEWQKELSSEEFWITRQKGTERAFTGKYWNCTTEGVYVCRCCGKELFLSEHKYDSGCGWPSFYQSINKQCIDTKDDFSFGMHRIEITCHYCDAHLGHVFDHENTPTGLRYCVNSASLILKTSPIGVTQ